MSSDTYRPFAFDMPVSVPEPIESVTTCPPVSPRRHRSVTAPEGFEDWGKGADFRQFQRERAKSVTTVTAFSGNCSWSEGVERLQALPPPTFLRPDRWEELVFDATRFLREWGGDAQAAGWRTVDVFGCYPDPQARRLDNAGLIILLHGRRVLALNDTTATIDAGGRDIQTFQRGFERAQAVPLWVAYAPASGP